MGQPLKQWLTEGKTKIQTFKYLKNEKSFLDEIKNIFHSFWRAIIWWKIKTWQKIADTRFKHCVYQQRPWKGTSTYTFMLCLHGNLFILKPLFTYDYTYIPDTYTYDNTSQIKCTVNCNQSESPIRSNSIYSASIFFICMGQRTWFPPPLD